MARENLLHHRGSGARKPHDEERLRNVLANCRFGQLLESLASEEALQPREECFHSVGLIAHAARFRRELAFGCHEVAPGFIVTPESIEHPAALELTIAVERASGVENRERFRRATRAGQITGSQQVDVLCGGRGLSAIEQLAGARRDSPALRAPWTSGRAF